MLIIRYVLAAAIAYLLGSISTGTLTARALNKPDLRTVGSKSTGATNALRTMGLKGGAVTFFGDVLKAVVAVLLGGLITGSLEGKLLAGLFVILGHNWPCFFGFKGGKGVASSVGVMLITFPIPALVCYVLTIALIYVTRYVSLGSMFLLTLFAILVDVFQAQGNPYVIVWTIVLAVLCIWRHRANINRLIRHEENKISFHKKG